MEYVRVLMPPPRAGYDEYLNFKIDVEEERRKDSCYFFNTGKRRSSLSNGFMPELLGDDTTGNSDGNRFGLRLKYGT